MLVERLTNPVVAPKPRKRRRRPRPASCLRRFRYYCCRPTSTSAPLRPRPALLLAELPRHRPSRCRCASPGSSIQRSEAGREKHAARQSARTGLAVEPNSSAANHPRHPPPHLLGDHDDLLGLRRPSTRRSLTLDRLHRACHPSTAVSCPSGPTNRSVPASPSAAQPHAPTSLAASSAPPPATTGSQTVAKRTRYHRSRAP